MYCFNLFATNIPSPSLEDDVAACIRLLENAKRNASIRRDILMCAAAIYPLAAIAISGGFFYKWISSSYGTISTYRKTEGTMYDSRVAWYDAGCSVFPNDGSPSFYNNRYSERILPHNGYETFVAGIAGIDDSGESICMISSSCESLFSTVCAKTSAYLAAKSNFEYESTLMHPFSAWVVGQALGLTVGVACALTPSQFSIAKHLWANRGNPETANRKVSHLYLNEDEISKITNTYKRLGLKFDSMDTIKVDDMIASFRGKQKLIVTKKLSSPLKNSSLQFN